MDNTITAQEIKRRGIGAVDAALRRGPVHVIQRNRPRYVILSEEAYQQLFAGSEARGRLWTQLLEEQSIDKREGRSREVLDRELNREREGWGD